MSYNIDLKVIEETVIQVQKEKKRTLQKEYISSIQKNDRNKKSNWLNFICFFIPIYGIFLYFYLFVRYPLRAQGVLKYTLIGLFLQLSFFIFCYLFLFDILGSFFITLFG